MKRYIVPRQRRDSPATSFCAFLLVMILALILTACQGLAMPSPGQPATPIPQPTMSANTTEPVNTPRPAPPATATPSAGNEQPAPGNARIGSEILFLRAGVLTAYDVASGAERPIAKAVTEFAASRDGQLLALVRDIEGTPRDVWLVNRDGSELRQVTRTNQAESSLSWAPDGQTLLYAASEAAPARPLDWMSWATSCATSEVRLLNLANGTDTTLAPGCEPAFSQDGRRIAFATRPETDALDQDSTATPNETNTIRLVNRQGQNGWSFATASGYGSASGMLVFAPAWSPDGTQLAYHRFMGYQALTDIYYTEMGGSFRGKGELLAVGAGWSAPPRFTPDSTKLVVVEYNFSDARGWGGYTMWSARVLLPGQVGEVTLPSGTVPTQAAVVDELNFATAAAWSPDGASLVVALPAGWTPDVPTTEPAFQNITPGELWRWVPGTAPAEQLTQEVDFASPVLWLPGL